MPTPHPTSFLKPLTMALAMIAPGISLAHVSAVDLFDDAVARGLPQSVVLSAPEGQLIVESALDVEVRFPGGESGEVAGAMYLATWRGERAVLTRSGDHLDISVPHAGQMEVIGFSRNTEESHHLSTGRDDKTEPTAMVPTNTVPQDPMPDVVPGRMRRATPAPTLVFWLFLHDDTLDVTRQHIHASYVAWWIADMKRLLPTRQLWAIYSQQVEGMTDMPYGQESSLIDWTTAVDKYSKREGLPHVRGRFEYKFMLVTRHEVAPRTAGLAWLGGDEAMASLTGRYSIIAHEYGHTMTATHDDAEIRWSSGWPCETNLASPASELRANCYRYSAANERRMRRYAANEWTVPVRLHPPEIPRRMVD